LLTWVPIFIGHLRYKPPAPSDPGPLSLDQEKLAMDLAAEAHRLDQKREWVSNRDNLRRELAILRSKVNSQRCHGETPFRLHVHDQDVVQLGHVVESAAVVFGFLPAWGPWAERILKCIWKVNYLADQGDDSRQARAVAQSDLADEILKRIDALQDAIDSDDSPEPPVI